MLLNKMSNGQFVPEINNYIKKKNEELRQNTQEDKIDEEMINKEATNIYEAFNITEERGQEVDAKIISISTQNPFGTIDDFGLHLDALDIIYTKDEMRYAYYRAGVEMKKTSKLKSLLNNIKGKIAHEEDD